MIENTVRSALASDYPNLRTIVVDDGSKDATSAVVREKFAKEIADGRVLLLTKTNAGKAEALNHALKHTQDEIYVGIDADTVIAPNAISILVPHFANAKVAAVAGNAKVGNRVNLWTRWQALEYITSQNFERRALNVFGAVSVVPGAIGAWRVSAVREAGGYHTDTVAEDADLTMSLLENGWRVVNEDRALAFTEAPTNAQRPHAPALPLVVRNSSGRMEAWRCHSPSQPSGLDRPAQHHYFSDHAAAGFTFY